jgi:dTDP-glucose pyrophosphorylase
MQTKPTLVILAAGMGSRYGGLKQLDSIGPSGEVILDYSIFDAIRAGFDKIVFVIRKEFEADFKEKITNKFGDKVNYVFVYQSVNTEIEGITDLPVREKPWGTTHAVLVSDPVVHEPFAVINADDYYGADGFMQMADYLTNEVSEEKYAMAGYILSNTLSDTGHVNRGVCQTDDNNKLESVVERLKIKTEGDQLFCDGDDGRMELSPQSIVSMNFWGFHPSVFKHMRNGFKEFVQENRDNPTAEYFIPLIVDELIKSKQASVDVLISRDRWYGVTYKEDKPAVVEAMQNLMKKGVYPEKLW